MKSRSFSFFSLLGTASVLVGCGLGGSSDLGDDRAGVGDPGAAGTGGGSSSDPNGSAGSSSGGESTDPPSDPPPDPNAPVACGRSVCAAGEVCCNESCGTCTPPGGACDLMLCVDPPPGGCSGIAALCIQGTSWSVEECACVPGTACGPSVCAAGEVCCNESCGICTPPGGACIEIYCGGGDPPPPDPGGCSGIAALCIEGTAWSVEECACVPGAACGSAVCANGDVCCNASCGICTPPGGVCTQQLCEPQAGGECTSDSDCALVDDYCGGCNCLAVSDPADAPVCSDPFNCFAAPCEGKSAACMNGTCTVVP
jgi:hypothetical protein